MKMSITKRNFFAFLTLFTILSGGIGAVIFHAFLPERYFQAYPFIPAFFYLLGLASIYAFDIVRRKAHQKLALFYMAVKMIKLLLSVVLLLFYCGIVKVHEKEFILTFVGFYFLYLIFETWFFSLYELNHKNKSLK